MPDPTHEVAPASVVLLRLVGLHDPIGKPRIAAGLAEDAGERQGTVTDRDHHVLGATEQVSVLVVEGEVQGRAGLANDPPHPRAAEDPPLVAQLLGHHRRLGEDLGDAGVELAADGPEKRRGVEPRVSVDLGEGRPVGGQEVRLGFGTQHRLTEVPGELLVGGDGIRPFAEDADLLRPEAEVDGGRVDEQGAEPVTDHGQRNVRRASGGVAQPWSPCPTLYPSPPSRSSARSSLSSARSAPARAAL